MDYLQITTGKLDEFKNFYGEVEFYDHNEKEIYDLLEDEASTEMLQSPELWCAIFDYNNNKYAIIAEGELTSDGDYVVGEIDLKTKNKSNHKKYSAIKDALHEWYNPREVEFIQKDVWLCRFAFSDNMPNKVAWVYDSFILDKDAKFKFQIKTKDGVFYVYESKVSN